MVGLRRFAGAVPRPAQKSGESIPEMMRQIARRSHEVLDSLRLTADSQTAAGAAS